MEHSFEDMLSSEPLQGLSQGGIRLDQQHGDIVVKNMSCPVPFILSGDNNDLLPPQSKWHVRADLKGG